MLVSNLIKFTNLCYNPCEQDKFASDNVTSKHIYNYKQKIRHKKMGERDIPTHFFYLAKEKNYKMSYLDEIDVRRGNKVISHIFMTHPDSLALFRTYWWFIGMDATYSTNQYHMPLVEFVGMTPCNKNYEWALEEVRNLLGDNIHPTVICY